MKTNNNINKQKINIIDKNLLIKSRSDVNEMIFVADKILNHLKKIKLVLFKK